MRSGWETYKGKRIFFAHYDHMPIEVYRAEVPAVEKELFALPKGSVLLLIDTTGIIFTPEVLNMSKNTALACKPYCRKTAILGMTGVRRTLLDMILKFANTSASAFETVEQAKDWLVAG